MPNGHSPVVPNALWALIEVVAGIRDVNSKILIEGFHHGVRAIGPEEESGRGKILIVVYGPPSDTRYGLP